MVIIRNNGSIRDIQVDEVDLINKPPHYNSSKAHCSCGKRIECIDIVRHMGFTLGNVIKYVWRSELKNGVEDLKKARWYLDDAISELESND